MVALLQLVSTGSDVAASLTKAEAWCRRAAAAGADLALLPEMWSHGYELPDPGDRAAVAEWAASAIPADGEYVAHFRRLAEELDLAIGLPYLEHWPGGPRNVVSVIDRAGQVVLHYAKVHTCEWDRERPLMPGDVLPVAALETAGGSVAVGAMVCFDREFPETARVLMLGGAEVVLVPNACPIGINRRAQLQTRAYENMFGVALANYAGEPHGGRSVAFDGMAYDRQEAARDMTVAEGGPGEEIVLAAFDLAKLREYRRREVWGNAYRRPELYGELVEREVRPPFERRRHWPAGRGGVDGGGAVGGRGGA